MPIADVTAGQIPYETISITVGAGKVFPVYGTIRYLSLLSATNVSKVSLSFTGSSFFPFPPALNISDFEAPQFWLRNDDVVDNTIVMAKGMATLRDNRVVVDAASPLPVTITNTSISVAGTDSTNADAEAVKATGCVPVDCYNRLFNGATFDRWYGDIATGARVNVKSIAGPVAVGGAIGANNPVPQGVVDAGGLVRNMKCDTNGNSMVRVTDNTNFMPTMDAAARRGYMQVTDGTNSASVIATINALKTDLSSVAGTATVTAGVAGLQAVGGNVASGSALSGNPVRVGGSDGTNVQNIRAQADNSTLPTAGNLTGITGYYNSAARTLTSGAVGFLSIDRGGKQIVVPGGTLDPVLAGYTATTLDAAAGTNAAFIKASAGMVYEVSAVNTAAYDVFLRLYNKASAPTVGTDVAYRVIRVPAGQSVSITYPGGAYFATGIAYATTKLVAYNDATALVAHDLQFTIQTA